MIASNNCIISKLIYPEKFTHLTHTSITPMVHINCIHITVKKKNYIYLYIIE